MVVENNSMKRNACFDFVKGYFVVAMAIYHWLNYCIIGHAHAYRYVNYVAEGFIFFSGYLCGEVYLRRFNENTIKVIKRLLIRSAKIFCLFVALNFIIFSFWGTRGSNGSVSPVHIFINNFFNVFFIGNDTLMAFEILLPISYLLLLCPLFLYSFKWTHFYFILIVVYLLLANMHLVPISYNLQALLIGLGGICTSIIIQQHRICRTVLSDIITVFLGIVYFLIVIPLFNINGVMVKYVVINLVVLNLFVICNLNRFFPYLFEKIECIGKYSLLMYLYQILYLQIISALFCVKDVNFSTDNMVVFLLLVVSSFILCHVVDLFQRNSMIFSHFYALIFK